MSEQDDSIDPAFPSAVHHGGNQSTYYTGLNVREYAAIHLRQPISGVPRLDDAIRAARREAVVLSLMAGGEYRYIDTAIDDADALIAKLEGKP